MQVPEVDEDPTAIKVDVGTSVQLKGRAEVHIIPRVSLPFSRRIPRANLAP
jgi:hypothetical protein